MLADGLNDFVDREIFLPSHSIPRVVAATGAVQTQEAGQTVRTEFALQYIKSVTFKLLIRHFVEGDQSWYSLIKDIGFCTGIPG